MVRIMFEHTGGKRLARTHHAGDFDEGKHTYRTRYYFGKEDTVLRHDAPFFSYFYLQSGPVHIKRWRPRTNRETHPDDGLPLLPMF